MKSPKKHYSLNGKERNSQAMLLINEQIIYSRNEQLQKINEELIKQAELERNEKIKTLKENHKIKNGIHKIFNFHDKKSNNVYELFYNAKKKTYFLKENNSFQYQIETNKKNDTLYDMISTSTNKESIEKIKNFNHDEVKKKIDILKMMQNNNILNTLHTSINPEELGKTENELELVLWFADQNGKNQSIYPSFANVEYFKKPKLIKNEVEPAQNINFIPNEQGLELD